MKCLKMTDSLVNSELEQARGPTHEAKEKKRNRNAGQHPT
jgi:hypothetical protein